MIRFTSLRLTLSAGLSLITSFTPSANLLVQKRITQVALLRNKSTSTKKYKMKSHKGAAARWHKTKSGHFKHGPIGVNHGNSNWSSRILARTSRGGYALSRGEGNHIGRIRKLMPYA
ncbi:hypothetical protein V1520DRAFT_347630 [Lipomyces starkeyi]|uniref:50S ribosomal protein L35 n=1 Tax=Lipomyces starkeyi NRRL Y-11557 TaxID=675824 RepID=A0A1E3QGG1_LIPST|nr:hypothetical protein LIPSTDRAFT_67777 [Lipomyces starkeyi NRRL Y-11557]